MKDKILVKGKFREISLGLFVFPPEIDKKILCLCLQYRAVSEGDSMKVSINTGSGRKQLAWLPPK